VRRNIELPPRFFDPAELLDVTDLVPELVTKLDVAKMPSTFSAPGTHWDGRDLPEFAIGSNLAWQFFRLRKIPPATWVADERTQRQRLNTLPAWWGGSTAKGSQKFSLGLWGERGFLGIE
jgi:hypothetical protein